MKMTGRMGQDVMVTEVGNDFVIVVPLPKWAKKGHILISSDKTSIKVSILQEDLETVYTSYLVSKPHYSINTADYKLRVANNSITYGFAGLKFGMATISIPKV